MIRFSIVDSPNQQLSTVINGRRVTIRIRYNTVDKAWYFDFALDGEFVLHGRKIVLGVDLVRPFNFGVGAIFAYSEDGQEPNRTNLINGSVGLYQSSEAG